MEEILIFPFSGTAIEALDCFNEKQKCVGFISDNLEFQNTSYLGINIFSRKIFEELNKAKVLAVNGSPTSFLNRKEIIASLELNNERFCNIIHPGSTVGKNVKLGFNVLIMSGVVITANAEIGNTE